MNELSYVRGNTAMMAISLVQKVVDGNDTPIDLQAYDSWNVAVKRVSSYNSASVDVTYGLDAQGRIILRLPHTIPCGLYSIEVTMTKGDVMRRSYEKPVFNVVETNGEAQTTYDIYECMISADIEMSFQLVPIAETLGKNAYEMWRDLDGNENKTLQEFIDTVLNLATVADSAIQATQSAQQAAEQARHGDYIGNDNFVYRWNGSEYQKTDIFVKGDTGTTPHIDPVTKHWMIGDEDTGVVAEGTVYHEGGDEGGGEGGGTSTDEKVITNPINSSTTYYPIVGVDSNQPSTKNIDANGFTYFSQFGVRGYSRLTLGNEKAQPDNDSRYGVIRLFGKNAFRVDLLCDALTMNRELKLPNGNGLLTTEMQLVSVIMPTSGVSLFANNYYRFPSVISDQITFTLPSDNIYDYAATIIVCFEVSEPNLVDFVSQAPIRKQRGLEFLPSTLYEVCCLWNGRYWMITSTEFDNI